MTLATRDRTSQPYRCSGVDSIDDLIDSIFFRVDTRFYITRRQAMKTRRQLLLYSRSWQQITCNLLDRELIKRHICIQRIDHPIAIGPDATKLIGLIPVAVGITSQVKPGPGPLLSIAR